MRRAVLRSVRKALATGQIVSSIRELHLLLCGRRHHAMQEVHITSELADKLHDVIQGALRNVHLSARA